MSKTQPARGMRDFLPADVRKRNYVVNIIKEVYESYGFEPLETPAVENLETLTGKYGEEGNQLIFKILKRGEKLDLNDKELADLALRYDLTVPLARVIAQHKNDLPKFFKRYQIQPVWRADRPARGRFREFYQCDVDQIGSTSMLVEAELCSAVSEILQRLGFNKRNNESNEVKNNFIIQLNHRKVLSGILTSADVPREKHTEALIALDKFDKIGDEAVAQEFAKLGLAESFYKLSKFLQTVNIKRRENIREFANKTTANQRSIFVSQSNESMFQIISDFTSGQEGKEGLSDIKKIFDFIESIEFDAVILINPVLARGLSYYTGTIMEINLVPDSEFEDFNISIGGGGRYDNLIGMFGKEQIPACGFSLGLERILVVMEERGMFQKLIEEGKLNLNSADLLIACFDEQLIGDCLKLAEELRRQDLCVSVYPEAKQNAKPYKYAEQINASFVCLVRENEWAENKVTLKNMRTGEQETIDKASVVDKIRI